MRALRRLPRRATTGARRGARAHTARVWLPSELHPLSDRWPLSRLRRGGTWPATIVRGAPVSSRTSTSRFGIVGHVVQVARALTPAERRRAGMMFVSITALHVI